MLGISTRHDANASFSCDKHKVAVRKAYILYAFVIGTHDDVVSQVCKLQRLLERGMASILSGTKRGKSVIAGVRDYFSLLCRLQLCLSLQIIFKVSHRSGKLYIVNIKMLFF
jgi:hypothetical protein